MVMMMRRDCRAPRRLLRADYHRVGVDLEVLLAHPVTCPQCRGEDHQEREHDQRGEDCLSTVSPPPGHHGRPGWRPATLCGRSSTRLRSAGSAGLTRRPEILRWHRRQIPRLRRIGGPLAWYELMGGHLS